MNFQLFGYEVIIKKNQRQNNNQGVTGRSKPVHGTRKMDGIKIDTTDSLDALDFLNKDIKKLQTARLDFQKSIAK